jgi:hypothetical protein
MEAAALQSSEHIWIDLISRFVDQRPVLASGAGPSNSEKMLTMRPTKI